MKTKLSILYLMLEYGQCIAFLLSSRAAEGSDAANYLVFDIYTQVRSKLYRLRIRTGIHTYASYIRGWVYRGGRNNTKVDSLFYVNVRVFAVLAFAIRRYAA